MLEARQIERPMWRSYFDHLSSSLRGKGVDITLSSVDGDVHQSKLWQLNGVTYDPHDDSLIVSCRDQEHVISDPESIRVEEEGVQVAAIEVSRRDGDREIIRFMSPLRLAEPRKKMKH